MSTNRFANCGQWRRPRRRPREKKFETIQTIQREVARELDQLVRIIFSARRKTGHFDLEAIEMAVRSSLHQAGATALSELLRFASPAADRRILPCSCGHRQQLKLLADIEVTTKAVERTAEDIGEDIAAREQQEIQRAVQLDLPMVVGEPLPILYVLMDGTGIPVTKKETEGRSGKKEGEPSHTREVKLGCVFTQTTWDEEGYAIRDPDSTTYVGAIETAEEFGKRIYLEAWKRGWSRARKRVVMGDGSEWIWNQADLHFPDATQIVDLRHAGEHLWEVARELHPSEEANRNRWIMIHQDLLEQGRIESLVSALRTVQTSNSEQAETARREAGYFEKNAERMRYAEFRRQHLFIGTGVIEAGCKTVIGSRCKQSGMFWTVRGANAIVALRCCQFNNRFDDYWEGRRA
jgi:hypothetical protein